MRVAALDVGKVRIGLAVCDELGLMAHPRKAIDGRDRRRAMAEIHRFAQEEAVDRFIVGVPFDQFGQAGPAARNAQAFAAELAQVTGRPVEQIDERFSTVEAARRLREGGSDARRSRDRIDSASACVLLQAWLDSHRAEDL